jgi:hypothetical protein
VPPAKAKKNSAHHNTRKLHQLSASLDFKQQQWSCTPSQLLFNNVTLYYSQVVHQPLVPNPFTSCMKTTCGLNSRCVQQRHSLHRITIPVIHKATSCLNQTQPNLTSKIGQQQRVCVQSSRTTLATCTGHILATMVPVRLASDTNALQHECETFVAEQGCH